MGNLETKKHIARSLQAARKAAGYKSAKEYAEHIGISKDTYTGYEQGKTSLTVELAWEFAENLGIDVDTLIGFESIHIFSDPDQEALNNYYESMNSQGRETLLNSAKLMSGSPDTRIEKDSPEYPGVPATMGEIA